MVKKSLMVFGVVFLLIGILGLFQNPILGVFNVNGLHNLVHLVSGVLFLIFAFQSEDAGRKFALVFGVIYALVAILGFIAPTFMMNLLETNTADNILHVVLAIVFIAVGTMKNNSMPMQA